jgi:hypothetical protein
MKIETIFKNNGRILGILQALSVGIFIYISIGEIILEEFVVSKNKFLKFGALIAGIFFVFIMIKFEPPHSHIN